MIVAGGFGRRLAPITDRTPKPLIPILDRGSLLHLLDGFERQQLPAPAILTHFMHDAVAEAVGARGRCIRESIPSGTAGAFRTIADQITRTTVVTFADNLLDVDFSALLTFHSERGALATMAVQPVADVRRHGVVLSDGEGRITGFQEKPEPPKALSNLANCGLYVFEPEILDRVRASSGSLDWSLDVFPRLVNEGAPFFSYRLPGYWSDIGNFREFRRASLDAASGEVSVETPADGWVRPGERRGGGKVEGAAAWVSPAAVVEDGVKIHGPAVVCADATLGAGSTVLRSVVLPGGRLDPGATLAEGLLAA